jgi:predicted PurR-regulated permease PerM
MDIKDLNKKQMIFLVLLVCFVVSIATGIVTVSLMQQVPKSVPQTINRVIERTINNVTATPTENKSNSNIIGDSNAVVQIYTPIVEGAVVKEEVPIGTGVIISDVGLVLVENSTLVNPTEATPL